MTKQDIINEVLMFDTNALMSKYSRQELREMHEQLVGPGKNWLARETIGLLKNFATTRCEHHGISRRIYAVHTSETDMIRAILLFNKVDSKMDIKCPDNLIKVAYEQLIPEGKTEDNAGRLSEIKQFLRTNDAPPIFDGE